MATELPKVKIAELATDPAPTLAGIAVPHTRNGRTWKVGGETLADLIINSESAGTTLAELIAGNLAESPVSEDGVSYLIGVNPAGNAIVRLAAEDFDAGAGGGAGGLPVVKIFSGDGSTSDFDLGDATVDKRGTYVFISGVYQQKNTYSVAEGLLSLDEPPPVGEDNVEVVIFGTVSGTVATLPEGSVAIEIVDALPVTGNFEGRTVYLTTDGKLYTFTDGEWVAAVGGAGGLPEGSVGIEIVDSLPESGNFDGRVVYLTSEGRLYSYTDGGWNPLVDTSEVTFPSGFTGIEILGALPESDNFEGRVVYLTTDNKLYRHTGSAWTPAIAASDITGQLSDSQIAALAAAKLTGTITTTQISDSAISTPKIAAGAITTAKIAANAVTAAEIAAGAIITSKIAAGAVTANEIAANAVTASKILAGSITAAKLDVNSVTATAILAGAILTEKIAAGAITTDKIAAGAITAATIAASAIQAAHLAANSVTATALQAGSVETDKIAANAVTAGKIAAAAITATKIDAGAVTTPKIAAQAVTAAEIAAGAITTDKIVAGAITAAKIAAGAITADKIAAGAITADKVAVGSLSALSAELGAVDISDAVIGSLTVDTINLAGNAVTVQAGAETAGGADISGSAGFSQMQSVTVSWGANASVWVFFEFRVSSNEDIELEIRSGGVVLANKNFRAPENANVVYMDMFPTGAISGSVVTAWMRKTVSGTATVFNRKLLVLAAKR